MRCSLFGKLAAKRDFIALFSPREFLNAWEPWMQASVSASRQSLGEAWQQAYLTAPIWRFWLGADICGATVLGAFMSSVDGMGRYYPLTLFAAADPGSAIPPPDLDTQDAWLVKAEDFLLSTLAKDIAYETITGALDQFAPPAEGTAIIHDGTAGKVSSEQPATDIFSSLRTANFAAIYGASSFWWTVGGGDYAPYAFCCGKMPDPFLFAAMLTGRFNPATA
jgi:type VI secretion system protein ImpM